jgi:transcriptional regulator GlxA family with amidase domain
MSNAFNGRPISPHDSRLPIGSAAARPEVARRLDDALRSRDESTLRVDDLASAVGVSARTVYRMFSRYRGVPPISYLRVVRLEHVRNRLLAAAPGDTVTSVALDYGFEHLGRFAEAYRRSFGERPSETLRRTRAVVARGVGAGSGLRLSGQPA